MSKDIKKGKIVFHLPDNFTNILEEAFEEECVIAAKKWKINNISDENKKTIKEHSYAQLKQKINDVTYDNWEFTDSIITITIIDELISIVEKSDNGEINVTDEDNDTSAFKEYSVELSKGKILDSYDSSISRDNDLIVFNVTQGFTLTSTANRKTVELKDFYEYFNNVLVNWMKTATFYGVASLS